MILKYILPLLAIAGLTIAAVEATENEQVSAPQAPPGAMPESPYPNGVAGVGLVEANSENISVGSTASGVVTRVFVKVGDSVEAGAPLFQIDDRALQAELTLKKAAVVSAQEALANAQFDRQVAEQLTTKAVDTANDLEEKRFAERKAKAALGQTQADVQLTEANLGLLTVHAPVAGQILQLKLHAGEFAPESATTGTQPAILLGNTDPLYLRAEIDENDAWRVQKGAGATGFVRGNASEKIPLTFVRFEPYVVAKTSLTGTATERTDTRVLQVIFALPAAAPHVFAGEQMDVFVSSAAGEPPAK